MIVNKGKENAFEIILKLFILHLKNSIINEVMKEVGGVVAPHLTV